jgi:hypothetical protein
VRHGAGTGGLLAAVRWVGSSALVLAVTVGWFLWFGPDSVAGTPIHERSDVMGVIHPDMVPAFKDGPPARTTGGFGEESCVGCHFGADENDGVGRIEILGLPERYSPGGRYPLTILLTRPGMEVGGFQLAARLADGETQAGAFHVVEDDQLRVGLMADRDVEFVHHTYEGVELSAPDTARWSVTWLAPESLEPVHFHAAGVAADDDDSQVGDFVYTTALELEGEEDGGH